MLFPEKDLEGQQQIYSGLRVDGTDPTVGGLSEARGVKDIAQRLFHLL